MKREKLKLILELHRATHQVGLYVGRLKGSDLSQAEAIILAYLHEHPSATMSDLHRAFGHRRSTLTNVVERLVTRGLAMRNMHPDDRRSLVVTLSRKGTTTALALHRWLSALEKSALQGTADRDIVAFRALLSRLGGRKSCEER
jgi:DNA-binding MarR family transcriptional regulator